MALLIFGLSAAIDAFMPPASTLRKSLWPHATLVVECQEDREFELNSHDPAFAGF